MQKPTLASWLAVWLALALLVLGLLGAGGAAIFKYSSLETRVDAHASQIHELKEALGRIECGISNLRAGQAEIKGKIGVKM